MSVESELATLVVRLTGDSSGFTSMMEGAEKSTVHTAAVVNKEMQDVKMEVDSSKFISAMKAAERTARESADAIRKEINAIEVTSPTYPSIIHNPQTRADTKIPPSEVSGPNEKAEPPTIKLRADTTDFNAVLRQVVEASKQAVRDTPNLERVDKYFLGHKTPTSSPMPRPAFTKQDGERNKQEEVSLSQAMARRNLELTGEEEDKAKRDVKKEGVPVSLALDISSYSQALKKAGRETREAVVGIQKDLKGIKIEGPTVDFAPTVKQATKASIEDAASEPPDRIEDAEIGAKEVEKTNSDPIVKLVKLTVDSVGFKDDLKDAVDTTKKTTESIKNETKPVVLIGDSSKLTSALKDTEKAAKDSIAALKGGAKATDALEFALTKAKIAATALQAAIGSAVFLVLQEAYEGIFKNVRAEVEKTLDISNKFKGVLEEAKQSGKDLLKSLNPTAWGDVERASIQVEKAAKAQSAAMDKADAAYLKKLSTPLYDKAIAEGGSNEGLKQARELDAALKKAEESKKASKEAVEEAKKHAQQVEVALGTMGKYITILGGVGVASYAAWIGVGKLTTAIVANATAANLATIASYAWKGALIGGAVYGIYELVKALTDADTTLNNFRQGLEAQKKGGAELVGAFKDEYEEFFEWLGKVEVKAPPPMTSAKQKEELDKTLLMYKERLRVFEDEKNAAYIEAQKLTTQGEGGLLDQLSIKNTHVKAIRFIGLQIDPEEKNKAADWLKTTTDKVNDLNKAIGKANDELKTLKESKETATAQTVRDGDNYIKELEKHLEDTRRTSEKSNKFEDLELGADKLKTMRALEAATDLKKLNDELGKHNAVMRMSDDIQEKWGKSAVASGVAAQALALKMKGASDAEVDFFVQQRFEAKAIEDVKKMMEDSLSPMEKYAEKLQKLAILADAGGAKFGDVLARALKKAKDELTGGMFSNLENELEHLNTGTDTRLAGLLRQGVSQSIVQDVKQLSLDVEVKKLNNSLEDSIELFRVMADVTKKYGKEALDAATVTQLLKMRQDGVSSATIDALASRAMYSKALQEGARVTREFLSPQEKHEEHMQELQRLLGLGAISEETFTKAAYKANLEIASTTKSLQKLEGVLSGSADATQHITEYFDKINSISKAQQQAQQAKEQGQRGVRDFLPALPQGVQDARNIIPGLATGGLMTDAIKRGLTDFVDGNKRTDKAQEALILEKLLAEQQEANKKAQEVFKIPAIIIKGAGLG